MYPMEPMHWFWSSGFWVFPIVMMTLMVVVVFTCARLFLGRRDGMGCLGGHGPVERAGQTALDVAKQRYARGEITKQEYEEIKSTLAD